MEISVAEAISDSAYYALASNHFNDLKIILTSLRWVQSRFLLESSLGGIFGVEGLLRDYTMCQNQNVFFRPTHERFTLSRNVQLKKQLWVYRNNVVQRRVLELKHSYF